MMELTTTTMSDSDDNVSDSDNNNARDNGHYDYGFDKMPMLTLAMEMMFIPH